MTARVQRIALALEDAMYPINAIVRLHPDAAFRARERSGRYQADEALARVLRPVLGALAAEVRSQGKTTVLFPFVGVAKRHGLSERQWQAGLGFISSFASVNVGQSSSRRAERSVLPGSGNGKRGQLRATTIQFTVQGSASLTCNIRQRGNTHVPSSGPSIARTPSSPSPAIKHCQTAEYETVIIDVLEGLGEVRCCRDQILGGAPIGRLASYADPDLTNGFTLNRRPHVATALGILATREIRIPATGTAEVWADACTASSPEMGLGRDGRTARQLVEVGVIAPIFLRSRGRPPKGTQYMPQRFELTEFGAEVLARDIASGLRCLDLKVQHLIDRWVDCQIDFVLRRRVNPVWLLPLGSEEIAPFDAVEDRDLALCHLVDTDFDEVIADDGEFIGLRESGLLGFGG